MSNEPLSSLLFIFTLRKKRFSVRCFRAGKKILLKALNIKLAFIPFY